MENGVTVWPLEICALREISRASENNGNFRFRKCWVVRGL
ncbi:hypothetical protein ETAA8_04770 [Anatilimnocola aggregata]|uniref:Uncharacterized protein n=1 Tax=Anatilimnocola aggregata TaxID=2528021 RepID=A0A517Y593_9BACT|nr:hypothetical protein ETAA8_04770 [Anatilimnocola aggregata]